MAIRQRFVENPFFVLGVAPETSRVEVERAGQRLLAELAISRAAALHYDSPLGPMPRTAELVREALAELRDPARRLVHEVWAQEPVFRQ